VIRDHKTKSLYFFERSEINQSLFWVESIGNL